MGQTIAEKILSKYAGHDVKPGEYISPKDFVGPIGYSFTGVNAVASMLGIIKAIGATPVHPERWIFNGDHNTPARTQEDLQLFRDVRQMAEGAGVTKIYDKEGIGHVVNLEKGDIVPGTLFVHSDPQATLAGGVGAYYTNGGRLGSCVMEAYATGAITLCVPDTYRIEINGKLPENVCGKDVWMKVLSDIGPDGALGMILEYAGTAIDEMSVESRMILCGSAGFCGSDGAILQSDEKTQAWYKDNFGIDVETIKSDPDAHFAKTLTYNASEFVPMVAVPPEVYTTKPVRDAGEVKIDQCIIGTCAGGNLEDLRAAANILKGKHIAPGVRFIVSPVTQRVYVQAAEEGLLATLTEAGAQVLAATCDVCLGVVAPLADGEVGLSQQTLNTPGRSGSTKADIYLASAATIATSALTGYLTEPAL